MVSQFIFFFIAGVFMSHLAQEARADRNEQATMKAALAESTEELRAVREALHANERVVTLGMLSAGIAHEIRNPLAAIMSSLDPATEILDELGESVAKGEDSKPQSEELRDIFRDCDLACRQLKRLALDLTSIARGGNAVPIAVDPGESIQAAARILKSRVKPPLRFEAVTETARTILADPGRVLQILLNLASNALDALGKQKDGVITLRAEDAGPFQIAFVVQDNGPGIPDELREKVFEPFFTTKGPGKGTGLGLHLVREITSSLSGTIRLESPEGGGTQFRVELPVYIRRTTMEKIDEHGEAGSLDRGRRGRDPQGTRAHLSAGAV
jgi:signal transduction histidine kinase